MGPTCCSPPWTTPAETRARAGWRPAEAEAWARKSVHAGGGGLWAHLTLAISLAAQGRLEDAKTAVEPAYRRKPGLSLTEVRRLVPNYHREHLERRIARLREIGLPE